MIKTITNTLVLFALLSATTIVMAQPAARRNQPAASQQKPSAAQNITTRAQISFPTSQEMKEDVVWRRDIYREIDLTIGNNSGLYYPVEPMGSQMNLFTYLFKLVLSGQVKAYEYRLDGNESFEADAIVKPLALLDNYSIYYERKDGKLKLDNSDIPSREVKAYYIKETSYFDQTSATFHTKVLALCPIMVRDDDFGTSGSSVAKYPLFWVKYDDVAPFLTKQTIMTSDINNAATMSIDDFFVKNKYTGKIYKTNNMLGQTLAQQVASNPVLAEKLKKMELTDEEQELLQDSILNAEQNRIERQLKDFEENIWGDKVRKDSLDSIAKAAAANPKAARLAAKANRRAAGTSTTTEKKTPATRRSAAPRPAGSATPRVTVRRERH